MQTRLIEFPFAASPEKVMARLGLEPGSDEADDFAALFAQAAPLARPRAVYGTARVEAADAESGRVRLAGVEFKSSLLAKNLAEVETAWPYIATCGRELYDFVQAIPDQFERYWGEEIMEEALAAAMEGLARVLHDEVYDGKTASMGPGSLPEWPIQQQRPLFDLMGRAAADCGVTLTETMLMLPNKSVSGVRFPNEHGYVNCRLCPREHCQNRKAEYDEAVAKAAM